MKKAQKMISEMDLWDPKVDEDQFYRITMGEARVQGRKTILNCLGISKGCYSHEI
jgi:hypothetical protein